MRDYRNRIDWLTPTLALSIWAAHFSLLWAASSAFPDQPAARWIAAILTVIASGALYWLWRRGAVSSLRSIPGLGLAIASTGIAISLLPAIIG
ncbi:hypothetical protein [Qipengyuania spongiae]|uniref:Uncharacterized protein n=1 Tax=Qipengyuania spongiae TaxID=2909673 RepID=A0ABY5SYL4_9SPHN|nr:hypothetical protein [Qipengyuania spongiae]UVI39628.1 hypothetical protein L1F33_01290 [Qipengyuania spongiae]